jgi:hypothetical protein
LYDYELADRSSMATSALVNKKYQDANPAFGTAFQQGMASLGIFPKGKPELGIQATTLRDIVTGDCMTQQTAIQLATSSDHGGNTIASPSTPVGGSTPASRVFLPEVIMDLVNEKLTADHNPEAQAFNNMIAMDQTIQSEIYTRPRIDVTAPQSQGSRPIAQNALPRNMVSISTSQISYALPVVSVGLQISDQAMASATIDLVSIIMAQQAEGERYRNLWSDMSAVWAGNPDTGDAALTVVNFSDYDSGAASGEVTQTGWLSMLYDPERKLNFDSIVTTMPVFQAILNRTGRPLMFDPRTQNIAGTAFVNNTGNAGNYGLDAPPNVLNWAVGIPNVLIVPTGVIPASQMALIDSRYALMRVRNASASYSAVEQMVLQRTNQFRWDVGEHVHRMFPDSEGVIKVVDISNSQP